MKIQQIDIFRVSIPFSSGRPTPKYAHQDFNAASDSLSEMETLLVQIHADNGLTGWGEAFGHLVNPVTMSALKEIVAPLFCHQSFCNESELQQLISRAEQSLHAFGRTGPLRYALSAIDIALWDLLAKSQQQPLWQCLGGTRNKIGVYPSLVSYGTQHQQVFEAKINEALDRGFTDIKIHETDYVTIARARQLIGERGQLMVDVNCPWSVDEAQSRIQQLKELQIEWIEEPIWPPDDLAGLHQVRSCGVKISAGENAAGEVDFQNFIATQAVDIFQPSVAKIGGITAMRKIIKQAQNTCINIIPHCFYFGPGLLATAQLISLLPESVKLEVPFLKWKPELHEFLDFKPHMFLPDCPGLGFNPDLKSLMNHTIDFYRCK